MFFTNQIMWIYSVFCFNYYLRVDIKRLRVIFWIQKASKKDQWTNTDKTLLLYCKNTLQTMFFKFSIPSKSLCFYKVIYHLVKVKFVCFHLIIITGKSNTGVIYFGQIFSSSFDTNLISKHIYFDQERLSYWVLTHWYQGYILDSPCLQHCAVCSKQYWNMYHCKQYNRYAGAQC